MRRAFFSGLVLLICLVSLGCDSGGEDDQNEFDFEFPIDPDFSIDPDFEFACDVPELGCYTLLVSTDTVSSGVSFEGTVTAFQPDGGYIGLGPELAQNGVDPIASLSITIPESCFTAGIIDDPTLRCISEFSFYSIGIPGAPIGAQEAYDYEQIGDGFVKNLQIGRRGIALFLKGEALVKMSRLPPVLGNFVPETIFVRATFTAKQAGT